MSLVATPKARCAAKNLEADLARLLSDLIAADKEMLGVLNDKRMLLTSGGIPRMNSVQEREQSLAQRLDGCQKLQLTLVARARSKPALGNGAASRTELSRRLLSSESLSHWLFAQRLLLKTAQLLETAAEERLLH